MSSRILYLVHAYHNLAGVEIHTKTLARSLGDQFEAYIVYPDAGNLVLIREGTEIRRIKSVAVPWPVAPYRLPEAEHALAQILDAVRPDLIHIQHFIHWPLSVLDQCLAECRPVFISFHDYFPFTPYFTMMGISDPKQAASAEYSVQIFGRDISPYLLKRQEIIGNSLRKARRLIVPAPYLGRLLDSFYGVQTKVVEIGIEPYNPLARSAPPPGPILRFGYVGSMIPQKGWDFLAKSFAEVNRRYPKTELVMHGGGGIPDLKFEGVRFCGGYKPEELPQIMSSFDVGVIPSVFAETFSMLLSEMWLSSIPTAVADIGALGERVEDGKNGKKFIPGDSCSLVKALCWFVENDAWRAWKLPKPRLRSSMIDEYKALYQSVL